MSPAKAKIFIWIFLINLQFSISLLNISSTLHFYQVPQFPLEWHISLLHDLNSKQFLLISFILTLCAYSWTGLHSILLPDFFHPPRWPSVVARDQLCLLQESWDRYPCKIKLYTLMSELYSMVFHVCFFPGKLTRLETHYFIIILSTCNF